MSCTAVKVCNFVAVCLKSVDAVPVGPGMQIAGPGMKTGGKAVKLLLPHWNFYYFNLCTIVCLSVNSSLILSSLHSTCSICHYNEGAGRVIPALL